MTNKEQRELTNEIINYIKSWSYHPESVDAYLKDNEDVINDLPKCLLIEIRGVYDKNIKA